MAEGLPGDVARVVAQALGDAGYGDAQRAVRRAAGLGDADAEPGDALRAMVLGGASMDSTLSFFDAQICGRLAPGEQRDARLALERCRFAELVAAGRRADALECLQARITPLASDAQAVRDLAAQLFAAPAQTGGLRAGLAAELQRIVPAAVLLPARRLRTLVRQAYAHQAQACAAHVLPAPDADAWPPSGIAADHVCAAQPVALRAVLRTAGAPAWLCAVGAGRVAAAGAGSATVWRAADAAVVAELALPGAARALAWSPRGRTLAIGCADGSVVLWDAASASTLAPHSAGSAVSALCWFVADGSSLPLSDESSPEDERGDASADEQNVLRSPDRRECLAVATEGGHVLRVARRTGTAGEELRTAGRLRLLARSLAAVHGADERPLILALDQRGAVHVLDAARMLAAGPPPVALPHGQAATERAGSDAAPDFASVLDYSALAAFGSGVAVLGRPAGARLCAESPQGGLLLCEWRAGALVPVRPPIRGATVHGRLRVGAAFARPGLLVLGSEDGAPRVVHAGRGRVVHTLDCGVLPACAVACDAGLLAAASDDGSVRLYDVAPADSPCVDGASPCSDGRVDVALEADAAAGLQ